MQSNDGTPAAPEPARIEAAFRSGTLTAVGIIVGFSLGFLTRWAGVPGSWTHWDYVGLATITAGIVLQLVALVLLLSVESLIVKNYNRAARAFVIGLVLVGLGVLFAVFADIGGQGQRLLG